MNIFLTGATGYIGSAVAAALMRAGHTVTALARSDAAADKALARGMRVVRGGLLDGDVIKAAAAASDGAIHTAATNDAQNAAADRAAVETILDALRATDKPFVYTSGVWVLGDTGGRVVDEDTPCNPLPIVAWRPAIENLVLAAAKAGVRSSVIRPGIVYGRGGGIPAMLVNSARTDRNVKVVGSGEQSWPTVHVDDLADLYVRVLMRAPAGSIWHGVSADAVKVRAIAEAASRTGGAEGRVTTWPLDEARTAMGPFADALAIDQRVSGTRAQRLLGWMPSQKPAIEELLSGSYSGA